MKHNVEFINLEEDSKDIVVSFAISDHELGVKSLILLRTLFMEEFLPEEEKGVHVSLEGDYFDKEESNTLKSIIINKNEIQISSQFRGYMLDVSNVPKEEIKGMVKLLKKQNYDNRFEIQSA